MRFPHRLVRRIGRVTGTNRNAAAKLFAVVGAFVVLASAGLTVLTAPVAQASVNSAINFQGKLVNTDGTNIPNGTYNIEFNLYTGGTGTAAGDPGGSLVWTEDWLRNNSQGVTVTDGVFQVDLGSITSLPAIFNNNTIWLSINLGNTNATCTDMTSGQCNGDGEMLPMIRFTAAPYALNSDLLDGLDSSAFGQLQTGTPTAQTGTLDVTQNLIAGNEVQAPLVDAASGTLDIGTSTAGGVTIGKSTTPFLIQGNSSSTFTATNSTHTTTVGFTTPTTNTTLNFPASSGGGPYTICDTDPTSCSATYQVAGSYLAKNAMDTSQFAVTAANYLYGFTNNNSTPTTGGVLSLDNQANTGDTLYVTASGNPGSGNALIVANSTGSSGNLIDLQKSAVSKFAVDVNGNVTQAGGSSTTDTVNGQTISAAASFTGTVTATTELFTPKLDTISATALAIGDASSPVTTEIDLNQNTKVASGKSLTALGTVKVGTAGSGTLFQNNGATQNVTCAYTGASGTLTFTTPKTVNDCTSFTITDTGATTLTTASIGTPTAGAGSIIYINNLSASTTALTVIGQSVPVGDSIMLIYDGTNWTASAAATGASTKLQDAYNNSAGAAPSILETAANAAVTVQSAISSGMSAGQELFGVRDEQSGNTLGNSILTVTSYGLGVNIGGTAANPAVQSGIDLQFGAGADRVLAVDDQTSGNNAGNKLTVRAGAGSGTAAGGNLVLVAGAGGATSGNGGETDVKGGTTTAGAGGLVVIAAADGGSSAANTVGPGGSITIQGGNATGGNNAGGSITLTAGNYHGTAGGTTVPGTVNIGSPVFTSISQTLTQTANNQVFCAASGGSCTNIVSALQTDLDTYGTIVMNVAGAFTGATVTMPSPTNQVAGRIILVSAASGSASFTLSATGMSSVNMAAGSTATLIWNGANWSGTTTASSLQQVYNNTSTSPASIITTSATKNILLQAGSGDDNANVFQVGNSAAAPVIAIDTRNTATGVNVADNGGVETGTGCGGAPSGWTAFTGTSSATVCQNTTAADLASGGGSLKIHFPGAGTGGANNDLGVAALSSSQLYNVSFNVLASTGSPTLTVQYLYDGTNLDATCSVPTNGTVNSTSFFKYVCNFTTTSSGTHTKSSSNVLRISSTSTGALDIYIDNLFVGAQNSTGTQDAGDLQVGGPLSQGLTLLTLDTFASDPFTGTINQNLYGSMYYNTTLGRIQCYESDGWGSCGAAPNTNLILEPEYAGAVLNPGIGTDTHIGTMTASLCSGSSRESIQPTEGTICASSEEYQFYRWTTSQVSAQTFSIFVKYQLPPTFGGFLNDNTINMVARVSSTTDASVAYALFDNTGNECGGNPGGTTTITTSANTWQNVPYNGNEATGSLGGAGLSAGCDFAAGDIITFRVDMSSKNNAYAYASQITFTMLGK